MQPNEIKWGSYKSWEGPYTIGKNKYRVSSTPSDEEKFLAVITATEGGCFDAVNMYDSCLLSCGLVQWCEANYSVSNLLGFLAETDPELLRPLNPALALSEASFKRRSDGKWRFFFNDARGEVSSVAKQQALFFKDSTGAKGTWNDPARQHAKTWAACAASLWDSQTACAAQVRFTARRLSMFLTKDSQAILFGPQTPKHNDGIVGAIRAAYYSFAANLPAIASEQLRSAVSQSNASPWSETWMVEILKQLTFGPKIMIYPGRYDKIRPVIESLFGVDLPDMSKDLSQWHADVETNPVPGMPDFLEIKEVQEELIAEGYDLGPRGADGAYGAKTKQAVRDFQASHGLGADGVVGPNTRRALMDAYIERTSNAG